MPKNGKSVQKRRLEQIDRTAAALKKGSARKKKAPNRKSHIPRGPTANPHTVASALARLQPHISPRAGAGMPPFTRTTKVLTWARGVLACATTSGYGFITLRPVFSNDGTFVSYSLEGYTGSTIVATGAGTAQDFNNSPYQSSDFGSGDNKLRGRVVGMRISLKYTGPILERGGRYVALQDPNHTTVLGMDFSTASNFEKAEFGAVSGDCITVTWDPLNSVDHEFAPLYYLPQEEGSTVIQEPLAIQIMANPGAQFEFEAHLMYECIGKVTTSFNTETKGNSLQGVNLNEGISQCDKVTRQRLHHASPAKVRSALRKAAVSSEPSTTLEREMASAGRAARPFAKDVGDMMPNSVTIG